MLRCCVVDLVVLDSCGSSNARLKDFFTCQFPKANEEDGQPVDKQGEDYKKKDAEWQLRKKFEERISNRLNADITFSLKNFQFYSAVDLAWEPPPIAPALYPMLLYAQGKLNLAACATQLNSLGCADQFCERNEKKEVIGINLPKFCEVSINLVRSIITRRLAAQSNRYSDLYPYFKFESRGTSQVGKLRADIMSQRSDIMADQFGYEAHDEQVDRDMMMYGHQLDFIRCAWERELQWVQQPKPDEDQSKEIKYEAAVVREGLSWINPHPTRVFYDNAHPMSSINDDNGCEYIGFWDVLRFKDVAKNPKYWNRKNVGYNSEYASLFTNYTNYFSQYYCTVTPPTGNNTTDLTSQNDRKNWVGVYAGDEDDSSIVVANYFEKIIPKEWGIGNYPYPVWVRFVVAGWETVMYAEFLPSTPAAYAGFNQKDDRRLNLGIGHELLTYQDHMSNLTTALLMALKGDNIKILVIDIDHLKPEQVQQIRKDAKGESLYTETKILEVSRAKLEEMGLKIDDIIKLVETKSSEQITKIVMAMGNMLQMVERLAALSPQEQGQPAPREISATETNLIAGTTESVYNFISNAIDRFRNAKKRIIYESYVNFGEQNFRVPVMSRYPRKVITEAGFEIKDEESTGNSMDPSMELVRGTVLGSKRKLIHDYIFTSRDGAERTSNAQGAQYITEVLKSVLPIPAVQEQMTKTQLFDLLNELFRMGGNYDLKLESEVGGDEPLSPSASEQLDAQIEKITNIIGQNSKEIATLMQAVTKLGGGALHGNGSATSIQTPTVPIQR